MHKTFLFAGSSSLIATHTASLLNKEGHRVIGISTKPQNDGLYDQFFNVPNYREGSYPVIDEPLDGLVYFPGTINLKPINRLTAEDFFRDFEINAIGAAICVRTYLANLKQTDHPSVVLFSSVAASLGLPFHVSVSMAKGAIEGLTKALAGELSPTIRVNCIAPSMVNTPMAAKFLDSLEKRDAVKKRNPLRKVGEPGDVANMVKFLLQEDSNWMTGEVLRVDGGMHGIRN